MLGFVIGIVIGGIVGIFLCALLAANGKDE